MIDRSISCVARGACVRLAVVATVALLAIPCAAQAQPLSLRDVLARAAAQDPARPATEAHVQAADAAVRQAAVKPNPRVGVDVENFAGSGDREVFDQTESTLYYEQIFERGGKREARTRAARADVVVARLRGQIRALDLLATVQTQWVEAVAAEAAIGVAEERLSATQRLERETARRVSAARDPLFAVERARTAVALARIALDQARESARNARAALAAYLGLADVEIDLTAFNAMAADAPPPGTADVQTADLAVLEAQRDAALARVRVEESRAVQDPTFRAGVRHFREGGDVAFIVGGSIPLGRNDTNRGAIERARAERLAAEAEIAAARAARDREIARLIARRRATAAEAHRIDAEVLPSARRALDLVQDGYRRGGGAFTFLEVAEAQRAVIDARARRVELLESFHTDGVRLDRLTGRHAPLIASAEPRR